MNAENWWITFVMAVCIVALLAGGHSLRASADDALDEASLINVLESDAGWVEKQAACRGLRQAGTAASVPALAALLGDEKLSHLARYALEPMPYPEVDQALRDALAKTEGSLKAGVIISLGARRDPKAAPLLVPLLEVSDMDVARAAAGALGRIATPCASKALLGVRKTAPEALRRALAEGLLAAGQHLAQDGKDRLALSIYRELLAPRWPMHVRMGAFRGRAYARPDDTHGFLLAALLGDEPAFHDMAAQIVAETSGEKTTRFYADALSKVSASAKVALLRGLAGRGDLAARSAVAEAVTSTDRSVKLAAVRALAALGGASDVPALTGLLVSDDAEMADAAKASLTAMKGEGVDAAMAAALPGSAVAVRVALLDLLASRRAEQAIPVAVGSCDAADLPVRIAGLRALALLGREDQAPVAMGALTGAADSAEQAAAEKALAAIASRTGDAVVPIILGAMPGAGAGPRTALLRVLAQVGGAEALATVHAALDDAEKQTSDEAVRLLSNWPTLDAVPHLRELAESDDLNRQVLGLRGFVRLAGTEPSAEKKAQMFTEAMDLAKRPDEKKLVLAAWGTIATGQSLDALLPHLEDAAVRNEAASAIMAVAAQLAKKDETGKGRAIDALGAVLEKCEDAAVRENAQKTLDSL